ncbi:DNA repair protein RecO C-terminal domain-containing protein, partial [Enterococcus faecalis]|uniref:DNA repair protein RecO C-terminal domain-containing protein n=1 Tax=Enterococcus faecalis TaxID=1351 RepID=UPI003D6AC85A
VLCEKHWHLDHQPYHPDPTAIHFIPLFSQASYEKVQNIQVKEQTKKSIRETIDMLYDEYDGLHLKSRKFIDHMKTWENTL